MKSRGSIPATRPEALRVGVSLFGEGSSVQEQRARRPRRLGSRDQARSEGPRGAGPPRGRSSKQTTREVRIQRLALRSSQNSLVRHEGSSDPWSSCRASRRSVVLSSPPLGLFRECAPGFTSKLASQAHDLGPRHATRTGPVSWEMRLNGRERSFLTFLPIA